MCFVDLAYDLDFRVDVRALIHHCSISYALYKSNNGIRSKACSDGTLEWSKLSNVENPLSHGIDERRVAEHWE